MIIFIADAASEFDFGRPESNRHSLGLRLGSYHYCQAHLRRRLQLSAHFFVSPLCVHFSVFTDESLLFSAGIHWPSQRHTFVIQVVPDCQQNSAYSLEGCSNRVHDFSLFSTPGTPFPRNSS
jgi:hypothetical protein